MNALEFFYKVIEMRHLQKAYLKNHNPLVLKELKAVEREIDAEIERVADLQKPKPY